MSSEKNSVLLIRSSAVTFEASAAIMHGANRSQQLYLEKQLFPQGSSCSLTALVNTSQTSHCSFLHQLWPWEAEEPAQLFCYQWGQSWLFLRSVCHDAVFGFRRKAMLIEHWCLVAAEHCCIELRTFQFLYFSNCPDSEGTEPWQLISSSQMDIPYHIASCGKKPWKIGNRLSGQLLLRGWWYIIIITIMLFSSFFS